MARKIRLPINAVESAATQRALRQVEDELNAGGTSGAAGPPGPAGATGAAGSAGATGATGAAGSAGATGATGAAGSAGATGPAGPAPSGTGVVSVTGGVLNTPYTDTQLTTHINTFTSGLKGAVPSSGGGTANYLRADGSFATPAGTFVSAFIGLGFFGDASDGSVNFDGSSTVLGAVPTTQTTYGTIGSVQRYSFTRDLHLDDMTLGNGVFLVTNCRVFVRGTLIGPSSGMGYIGLPGQNGFIGTAGGGGAGGGASVAGVLGAQAAGGAGGSFGGGAPVGGSAAASCPPGYANTGGTAGATPNGNGVGGGAGRGGGGGSTASAGGIAGAVTIVSDIDGSLSNILQAMTGRGVLNNTRYTGGSGGGGGRGTAVGNGVGGGGGAGGGPAVLCAREITNASNVTLYVAGGVGGNAYQGALTAGQTCGGGGGGGGGWCACVIGTGSFPNTTVTGGAGGLKNSAGGGDGGAGGNGYSRLFRVGA